MLPACTINVNRNPHNNIMVRPNGGIASCSNAAVTDAAALMLTVQLSIPAHASPQPMDLLHGIGVALRLTEAPLVNSALQLPQQEIAAGRLVTVPAPVPALDTLSG